MINTVIRFIENFQNLGTIDTFTQGCCYWFAVILKERFQGTIMYNPVDNHFASLIDGHLYDITGELTIDGSWYEWEIYSKIDTLETDRIVRDCIEKVEN